MAVLDLHWAISDRDWFNFNTVLFCDPHLSEES